MSDLISRESLKKTFKNACIYGLPMNELYGAILKIIDNAPTVEAYTKDDMTREYLKGYNACKDMNERPQGELAEKLKDRIEENVCRYCRMNKHCELCEISRVFSIIALTDKEMKGGAV